MANNSDIETFLASLENPSIQMCLVEFFEDRRQAFMSDLVQAVRMKQRDAQRESQLAGMIDVYESAYTDLVSYYRGKL